MAWPRGSDPGTLLARTRAAHERFLSGDPAPDAAGAVRAVVAASWLRSLRSGVDPERPRTRLVLDAPDLNAYRRAHPLWPVLPVVRRLLLDGAAAEGLLVALSDAHGRLIWIGGDHGVRRAVERVGFVEGADWREEVVGTNAPGTALATGRPVQVFAAEHFTRPVHPWSCTAVVLRDPADGSVLGALDVTGRDEAASPLALSLLRATAAAVEAELRAAPPRSGPAPAPARAPARLRVLGTPSGVVEGVGPLTLRHAEVLVLLAAHPRGLHADELGALLHPDGLGDVTVRAEVSRLRRAVPGLLGTGSPYRLTAPLRTDADHVADLLRSGDVAGALAAAPGPLLPRSRAPGVERLRDALTADLRAAVLTASDPASVERWVRREEGREDWEAHERLVDLTEPGSAAHARARTHLALLVRDLGAGPAAHPWGSAPARTSRATPLQPPRA